MTPDVAQLQPYLAAGFELIPLHRWDRKDPKGRERGKSPLDLGWRRRAYAHQGILDHAREGRGNIGVRLRGCDLVLDVDPRRFPPGRDPFIELLLDGVLGDALAPRVRTGGGGWHYYYRKPADVPVVDSLPGLEGLEFKSLGRQVVAAGSVHPSAAPYRWDPPLPATLDPPPVPERLLALIRRPPAGSAGGAGDDGRLSPEELKACLDQLDPTLFRDHDLWFRLMAACHQATAGEGRQEFLNWSAADPAYADQVWANGRRWDSLHRDRPNGATYRTVFRFVLDAGGEVPVTAAAEEFDLVDLQMTPALPRSPLEEINQVSCVVDECGAFRVYTRRWDPELKRTYYAKSSKEAFIALHMHKRVETREGKLEDAGMAWLKWPHRRQYMGVVFDPEHVHEDHLNLWTGWAVEPRRGDWSLLHDLVRGILCASDAASFEYVLNWMAFFVQRPGSPAEVALVFRGEKGTGKGTFGRALVALAGQHGVHITRPDHLTGKFNLHLRDSNLLMVDEAFWAGDKGAESVLKGLVTEPTLMIEPKRVDAQTKPNRMHIILFGNGDWLVPAGMDNERRYAVFDVLPDAIHDKARWDAINRQLYEEGGLAALLWDLQHRTLGDWHPRSSFPVTDALVRQKLESLDPVEEWWFERLQRGALPGNVLWDQGPVAVWADDLTASLELVLNGGRIRGRRGLGVTLGRRLAVWVPGIAKDRAEIPGERAGALETDSRGRATRYLLPSLADCRAAFEARLGKPMDWERF